MIFQIQLMTNPFSCIFYLGDTPIIIERSFQKLTGDGFVYVDEVGVKLV